MKPRVILPNTTPMGIEHTTISQNSSLIVVLVLRRVSYIRYSLQ